MRATLTKLKSRLSLRDNPYLSALVDGSLSREDFVETQIQFFFAVVFFSRPMLALAGRLSRPEQRLSVLANVGDEHGNGQLSLCHEHTFSAFLRCFGVDHAGIDQRALWPEVRAFNTTLTGVCVVDDPVTALATLGIIEDLFGEISSIIGRAIVARGILPMDQLVHYTTHEVLDAAHADGFYRLLEEPYASHPRLAYHIEQGFELGAYIFLKMYEDLYRNRARRWTRAVDGGHSISAGWIADLKLEK